VTNDDADDSDAPDDPVTRSMRSVWLTMREEDPPTRGLADLMIAARAKAEALQPREPWWHRAFAVMLRPPVLALATVVVLVGGAVVINNRSANLDVPTRSFAGDPPGVEQKPPAEERTRSLERPGAQRGAGSAATPGSIPVAGTGQVAEPPSLGPASTIERPAIKEPTKVPLQGATTKEKVGANSEGTVEVKPDGRVVNEKAADADKREIGEQTGLDFGGLVIAKDDAPATDSTADSMRTPAVPAPPSKGAQLDGEAVTQTSAGVRSARPQGPSVEQLVMQAEIAAGRKDCPAVRVTVDRIKKLDANVYKARVAKQAAIARCLK